MNGINCLIVGYGEVGRAHAHVLARGGINVQAVDLDPDRVPKEFEAEKKWPVDLILFAMRYSDSFVDDCLTYIEGRSPKHIGVLTTVPVGTTRRVSAEAFHSTTRGLHPRLDDGLLTIPKHFGGRHAEQMAEIFEGAGFPIGGIHHRPETTELAHILNNAAYGANIALAAEMEKVCRHYGVDYTEAVIGYTRTNNIGFERLDHGSKCRMVLTPPGAKIGGHCVSMSANLVPKELRGPILDRVATFNAEGIPSVTILGTRHASRHRDAV